MSHTNPCEPSPCGENAICRVQNDAGSCTCKPDHMGDPYVACRPECTSNSDCLSTLACVGYKCQDPCPGVCGYNAQCYPVNHLPTCQCLPGYSGDPFRACSQAPKCKDPSIDFSNVTSTIPHNTQLLFAFDTYSLFS